MMKIDAMRGIVEGSLHIIGPKSDLHPVPARRLPQRRTNPAMCLFCGEIARSASARHRPMEGIATPVHADQYMRFEVG